MRMFECQQEEFILGIKLNLATLNKSYMEKVSEVKSEKTKQIKTE